MQTLSNAKTAAKKREARSHGFIASQKPRKSLRTQVFTPLTEIFMPMIHMIILAGHAKGTVLVEQCHR